MDLVKKNSEQNEANDSFNAASYTNLTKGKLERQSSFNNKTNQ